MKSAILLLVVFVAYASFAKAPESAQQMMIRAKILAKKGEAQAAKKIFEQVLVQEAGTAEADLARFELKFIELELTQGQNRIFPEAKAAMEDIVIQLDQNAITEVRNKMWVRMEQGECDSPLSDLTPNEAMDELRLELTPKNVRAKTFTAGSSARPTVKIALNNDRFLQLQMSKYARGWIWNKTVICSRAL